MPNEWEDDVDDDDTDDDQSDLEKALSATGLTPEQATDALTQIQRSGMTMEETLQRAGRDIQREYQAGAQPAQAAAAPVDDDDDELTPKKVQDLVSKAAHDAQVSAISNSERRHANRIIASTIKASSIGARLEGSRLEYVRNEVRNRVAGNVKAGRMNDDQYDALLEQTAQEVIADELRASQVLLGVKDDEEIQARVKTAKGSSVAGAAGGPGNRTAAAGRASEDDDALPYGLTKPWYTEAETDERHERRYAAAMKQIG